jgi:hypothetical protein
MLARIAERIVNDRTHEWDAITPTTLLQTPRQVIIERFMDVALDPEQAVSAEIGTIVHEQLTKKLGDVGYVVKGALEFEMFGVPMHGSPDAWWPADKVKPFRGMPDIIELKITTSGSISWILKDGEAKGDHVAQVEMYRRPVARMREVDPATLSTEIRYYAMPQKETTGNREWTRMPSCLRFPTSYMSEQEIGDVHGGWSPPKGPKSYQGPPPTSVAENSKILPAAFEMLRNGASPEDVVAALECMCPRRFNGTGRQYCTVSKECAVLHHGTPVW